MEKILKDLYLLITYSSLCFCFCFCFCFSFLFFFFLFFCFFFIFFVSVEDGGGRSGVEDFAL